MLITPTPQRVHPEVRGDRAVATLIGAALAVAVLAQGAFHPGPFVLVAALVVAAAGTAAVLALRRSRDRTHLTPAGTAALWWTAFALWAALRAVAAGDGLRALPTVAVALVLAATTVTTAGLTAGGRDVVRSVVLALGVVVAGAGWLGTAFHLAPLSMPSVGLWRAASTLTYANAAAAVLVIVLLVAVTTVDDARHRAVLCSVLLLGLAATMSRGGALGLAVGLVVLLAAREGRARLRSLARVPVATGFGLVGLLPSFPEGSAAQPLPAAAGLAAGAAVLLGGRARLVAFGGAVALAAAGVAVGPLGGAAPATLAVGAIADTRLNGGSSDRFALARETLDRLADSPLFGVGPGGLDLTYVNHAGQLVHAWFTHLEYLQVAAETGLVGLALVLAGALALERVS
ncbi:O-antigen ligase family protein [Pseudonocardia xishanensis]|uniref:O-antigen ligase-related domain-containing protein n=1 Tax=Pseudonocardia xishanensis TaxID=630995 RepID=A0ABP8RWW4_9PSEU